jgi:RNA polymerase sigma-70 factor (ECF subfamily)
MKVTKRQGTTFGPAPPSNDNGRGGRDAFAARLVALLKPLRGSALRLTRDGASADDLVQDTIERALINREQFKPGTNLKAWVITIMRNLFMDECRRASLSPREWPLVSPADEDGFDARMELLSMHDIQDALAELPLPSREMFELSYFAGYGYREIAERFGRPMGTVGTHLMRVRLKLRAALEAVCRARLRELGIGDGRPKRRR